METVKQLSFFSVINTNGGDRVSYTYNEIDSEGNIISSNNKGSFFATDADLKRSIDDIKSYIRTHKLNAEEV